MIRLNAERSLLILLSFFLFSCQEKPVKPSTIVVEEPIDYLLAQRLFPYGKVDKNAYQQAVTQRTSNIAYRSGGPDRYDDSWQLQGPFEIGGRVTDLEMPSGDQNTIFVGSASGGIFKSTDKGQSFTPIFDEAASPSIGDIDLYKNDNNIIYVGTGESNAGGGSLAYDGNGVYKSIDGGQNWQHLGLEDAGSIGKVAISPQSPDTVYVAAMGDLFSNTGQRGVFKTTDGGQTWQNMLSSSDSTGAIDVAIHPQNSQIVYAALWERIRRPHNRQYGGWTSGVYRSKDGGATWDELTNGLPTNTFDKGRIGIAIAPSNPDIIYLYYMDAIGYIKSIYRSENGGDSWTARGSSGIARISFGWWCGKIFVSPTNPDEVYVTSLHMYRSDNGGASWTRIFSNAHVDHHAIFIHPQNPNLVLNGNDGGVYLSQLKGNGISQKLLDLPNNQFYTCRIDPSNPDRLYGGMQDNGTYRKVNASSSNWQFLSGGDGFGINVDPIDPNIFFVQSQFGVIRRTTDGGQSYQNITLRTGDNNWNTPLVIDPKQRGTMYTGNQRLYKSTNRGTNWTAISPNLVNSNNPSGNLTFGTITSIDVSPVNNQVIYTGADDGSVWVTKDGGSNWSPINRGLPRRWITRVCADPNNAANVYLTVSGFRFGESKAQVFKSEDYGNNWQDIGASLPDVPVNDIIADPIRDGHLYIATDIGVYYMIEGQTDWQLLGQDLPLVPITDLDLVPVEGVLAAATYGRSMYTYSLAQVVSTNEEKVAANRLAVFPNPSRGTFFLNFPSDLSIQNYQVFNLNGQIVSKGNNPINVGSSIDLGSLAKGQYILQVQFNNGETQQQLLLNQ